MIHLDTKIKSILISLQYTVFKVHNHWMTRIIIIWIRKCLGLCNHPHNHFQLFYRYQHDHRVLYPFQPHQNVLYDFRCILKYRSIDQRIPLMSFSVKEKKYYNLLIGIKILNILKLKTVFDI